MFDTVFNLIIVLIPAAIIIGRIVVGARNRRNPPPAPAQPRIPVHFEDEDSNYFNNRAPTKAAPDRPTEARLRGQTALIPNKVFPTTAVSGIKPSPAPGKTVTPAAPSGQKDFSINLNHLSALKQAVVMAEILGPPKAME